MKMGVRIIVDSASDIALDFANQNNIAFVPLKTNLGGVEYRDGIDILPDVFFEKLEQNKELAHTSQVNASDFSEVFEQVVAGGDEAVVITLSSGLSGTCQSAVVASEGYEGKVFVVDSLSATAGEQVLCITRSSFAIWAKRHAKYMKSFAPSEIVSVCWFVLKRLSI